MGRAVTSVPFLPHRSPNSADDVGIIRLAAELSATVSDPDTSTVTVALLAAPVFQPSRTAFESY